MNITFMVGNGFDLNQGLKTRYIDFYDFYNRKMKDSEDMLSSSIRDDHNYEMWSDMEIGIGKLLADVNEAKIDGFLDSKATLERLLVEYLAVEEQRLIINDKNAIGSEFCKHVLNFQNELNAVEKGNFKALLSNTKQQIHYRFVSFNYTSVLDEIIKASMDVWERQARHSAKGVTIKDLLHMPLHVHGGLTEGGLILGLDNPEQIFNEQLKTNPRLINYIVKPIVNTELGNRKIEDIKLIIDQSKYICLFGLSFGETDRFWWAYLVEWLKRDHGNRLILYIYDSKGKPVSGQEDIRNRDKEREKFIERSGCEDVDDVKNRIIVISNTSMFSFSELKILEDAKMEQEALEKGKST